FADEVPGRMRAKLGEFPSADARKLLGALRALDAPVGALALTGSPRHLSRRSPAEIERLLASWRASRLAPRRQLGSALVALSLAGLYGFPGPEWERIGYPGPLGPAPAEPRRLAPILLTGSDEWTCDVVVVGSGAGGGCVAGRLAQAGFDVVVLERGGYRAERDFSHLESESLSTMYLYGGTLAT